MFIYIPGQLITILTFPGVIIHEIAHRFFCDLTKVPVYEVKYFLLAEETVGYVLHGPTNNIKHQFLITIGPLIINTFLCAVFTFPFYISVFGLKEPYQYLILLLMAWLGFSSGIHAFPSNQDLNALKKVYKKNPPQSIWLRVLITTLSGFIRTFNAVPFFFCQPIYAYLISRILPYMVS